MARRRIEDHPALRLRITVATAKRLFPGTPAGPFYHSAPFDGRGRFLTLAQAYQIARAFHWPRREEAKSARRSSSARARHRAERAARLPGAVDHLAEIVAAEFSHLEVLAAQIGGQNEVTRLRAAAAGIVQQAARGRARLVALVERIEEAGYGR